MSLIALRSANATLDSLPEALSMADVRGSSTQFVEEVLGQEGNTLSNSDWVANQLFGCPSHHCPSCTRPLPE